MNCFDFSKQCDNMICYQLW